MRQYQATFIGIGAQKCASTWLYSVLQQCPDVCVSQEKEVDFFSYYFDRGYEWYERKFITETPRRHRGEISPSYFIHPAAAARAAAYNPKLQIFVTLRDPVKRAFSNHLHEARKGHISDANLTFETALENNPLYLDQGLYATHLKPWLDHFPREQVHVLFQEEIHQNRMQMAQQVIDALGLPDLHDFLDLRANESVRYRSAALGNTLWKMGNYARRNRLGRVVETVKAAPVISQLRAANREEMRDVVDPILPETEARLTDYFAPEVAELETLLGRSTPWDRFQSTALAMEG